MVQKSNVFILLILILSALMLSCSAQPTQSAQPAQSTQPAQPTQSAQPPQPFAEYEDGTYIGEAKGKREHLKVEITIENSRMTECRVIEHHDDDRYAKETVEVIPERILEAQSCLVDVLSGSTLTSQGIIDAVENALEKAKK